MEAQHGKHAFWGVKEQTVIFIQSLAILSGST